MAREVTLPELGENITAATVLRVLVAAGDRVDKDQALLTLESDKAEFDLPAPSAGTVAEVLVKEGDEVAVGRVILRFDGEGAPAPDSRSGAKRADEKTATKETPPLAPEKKAVSAARSQEPSKTPAPRRPAQEERAPVQVEAAPEQAADAEASPEAAPDPAERAPTATVAAPRAAADVVAAPSVRRLARELGLDIATVRASGGEGRVTAEDLYALVRARLAGGARGDAHAQSSGARDYSRWGETRVEQMSTVRRRTAEQMGLAWSSIPHVTHHDAADITELDRLREQFAPRVERAGAKLTVTAVLLKVVGSALKRFPQFNASVDMERSAIVYKEFVNVGVAVDTERGLLVPVIRRVDQKNIIELALELRDISEGARTRKLRPDVLQGATFTVTNLGGIGGTHFSPLINPPEVAVLGVSRSGRKPTWVDGSFVPRLMLPLSVSYDHRLIDGADAARFLRWICEALQEPFLMDLEGD